MAAVLWYSIITTPPPALGSVWLELDRVLRPGGAVLLSFQAGDNEAEERPNAYGSTANLTLYRHAVADVVASLRVAGFEIQAQVVREQQFGHESTPQAMLFAARRR